MGMSEYMRSLRAVAGDRLILVPASGVFLFDRSTRLLLVRDTATGLWGIPGGALEPGESPEHGARRELTEETGLVAGRLTLLGAYGGSAFEVTYEGGDRTAYVVTTFGTFEHQGSLSLEETEVDRAEWVDLQAVEAMPLRPEMRPMLDDARRWLLADRAPRGGRL